MTKQLREDIEIVSSALDTSWLKFNKLDSTSPVTAWAVSIWVDASWNVVIADTSTITINELWYRHRLR
jgi:hypothetical protein